MTNSLVKLVINEDGEKTSQDWHLAMIAAGSMTLFCTGEFYGEGEGNARGVEKTVKRGGITCENCLGKIKEIKKVKL